MAALEAYGDSWARGWIGAAAEACATAMATLDPTYATAHGSAGSLTHWTRPGMEPTFS